MSPDEGKEEYEEVQADLRKRDEEYLKANSMSSKDLETGIVMGSKRRCFLFSVFSKVLLEAFTLTFIAEWGDRSQITTIILAAREVSISCCKQIWRMRWRALRRPRNPKKYAAYTLTSVQLPHHECTLKV